MANWLFKTREWFFPGGRTYRIRYTFFVVTGLLGRKSVPLPVKELVFPFDVPEEAATPTSTTGTTTTATTTITTITTTCIPAQSFEPEPIQVETTFTEPTENSERNCRERLTTNIPTPSEKKRALMALVLVTDKEFQKANSVPGTGNTMAKLKYSDFKVIWEKFCSAATNDQLAAWEKKFAELAQ